MHVIVEWSGPGWYFFEDHYYRTQYERHYRRMFPLSLKGQIDAQRFGLDNRQNLWPARQLSDLITSVDVIDKTQKESHEED